MNELQPIVVALAAFVSVVYSVLQGNFGALFNLLAPILSLRSVDFSKLKADLLALSPTDRATLEKLFDSNLSVSDPVLLAKIVGAANVLDGAVDLAEDVVTQAVQVYGRALSLVAKFKSLFGLAGKLGGRLGVPSWVPAWIPSWVLALVTDVVLPALAVALPAEAPLINDLIRFLKGQGASLALKAAHAHYHAQAAQP